MAKERIIFLFAMQREADMIDVEEEENVKKVLVGISCVDGLPETTEDDVIINIGYAGSNNLPVGSIVEPSEVVELATGERMAVDKVFDCSSYPCFTSNDFVTETNIVEPCVFDMELYMISKLKHKALYSLKIVSDNLNLSDCEAYNDELAWAEVKKIVNKKFKYIV